MRLAPGKNERPLSKKKLKAKKGWGMGLKW
jgi:hypothetical protein